MSNNVWKYTLQIYGRSAWFPFCGIGGTMHSIARHIICLWIPWRCLGVHLLTHGQFDFQACSMLRDPMAMPRDHLYGQFDFKQMCEKSNHCWIQDPLRDGDSRRNLRSETWGKFELKHQLTVLSSICVPNSASSFPLWFPTWNPGGDI